MATQNYEVGGWYGGRQWNGTSFGAPGQITVGESAGQMVNPAVVAASNVQQGLKPGTNEAFLAGKPAVPGTTGGGGGTVPLTPAGIMGALATPSTAYSAAADVLAKEKPLIQQRYQSLLDEIKANAEAGIAGYETAQKTQLGSARARAGAAGTFYGGTELGTEANIRAATAQNEAILRSQQTTQEEKLAAQNELDQFAVAKEIANLGISEDVANRSGLKDVLNALFTQRGLDISAEQAATSRASQVTPKWSVQTSTQKQSGISAFFKAPETTSFLVEEKTGETVPISSTGIIKLKDPATGNVYQYPNPNDADLKADLGKGFQPLK